MQELQKQATTIHLLRKKENGMSLTTKRSKKLHTKKYKKMVSEGKKNHQMNSRCKNSKMHIFCSMKSNHMQ